MDEAVVADFKEFLLVAAGGANILDCKAKGANEAFVEFDKRAEFRNTVVIHDLIIVIVIGGGIMNIHFFVLVAFLHGNCRFNFDFRPFN